MKRIAIVAIVLVSLGCQSASSVISLRERREERAEYVALELAELKKPPEEFSTERAKLLSARRGELDAEIAGLAALAEKAAEKSSEWLEDLFWRALTVGAAFGGGAAAGR